MSRARELRALKSSLFSELTTLCRFFRRIRMQNPAMIKSEFRRLRQIEKTYYELFSEIRKYNTSVDDPRDEILLQDKERFLSLLDGAKTAYYKFKIDYQHWRQSRATSASILPSVPLPQFDGSVDGWVEFKTVFDGIVHTNSSLTNEEKFYYLKLNLKGEAYTLIAEYSHDGKNYMLAYNALINHYDTPRRWIHFYVQQILKFKPAPAMNRARFLNIHEAAFKALKAMNVRDLADYILFQLAYNNLDQPTRHTFDSAQEDPNAIPQTNDLLEFLRSLPSCDELYRDFHAMAGGNPTRVLSLSTRPQRSRCTFCNSNHFLAYCPTFKQKTLFEKLEFVRKRKLCINCLGSHLIKDCLSSKTCWHCKRKHHSLLHNDPWPTPLVDDQPKPPDVVRNRLRPENNSVLVAMSTALRRSAREYEEAKSVVVPESDETLEAVVRRLKLARRNSTTSVSRVEDAENTRTRRLVLLNFKSIYGSKANIVHTLVLRKLSKHVPRPITPRHLYATDEILNSVNLNRLLLKREARSKLAQKDDSLHISLSLRMPQYTSFVSLKVIHDWCTLEIESFPGYVCVTVTLESGIVQIRTFAGYAAFTVSHPNGNSYNFLSYLP